LRIALWALILAVAWTVALAAVAHSPGLHSTPGMWLGVFGLPGVVVDNWVQSFFNFHRFNYYFEYYLMFLMNWIFHFSVIQGVVSVKRSVWK
jgi:hypothetical protein